MTDNSFYAYQKKRFGLLLVWGGLNTLGGLVLTLFSKKEFGRNFWFMNAGWGFVNALLAMGGRRSATKNAQQFAGDTAKARSEAQKMRRLLLINVPLDILYVVSGYWLTRRAKKREKAWGVAVILQGAWLFIYDGLLAAEVKKVAKL